MASCYSTANSYAFSDSYLTDSGRERILTACTEALHTKASPLARDPEVLSRILLQSQTIVAAIDSLIAQIVAKHRDVRDDVDILDLQPWIPGRIGFEIGVDLAEAGIAPAHSLAAAAVLFVVAQPVVAECLARHGIESPERKAGIIVQMAIMDRVAVASASYVDYLMVRTHRSQKEERHRLARELHDLAAPSIALGLQNLDMFSVVRDSDPEESEKRLRAVRDCLLESIKVIHDIAVRSRETIGRGGLRYAILKYAQTIPPSIKIEVATVGDIDNVPESYCDEIYLIVREAIRNAVTHADPDTIRISLDVTDSALTIEIADDGCGFEVSEIADGDGHLGVFAMRERAELLAGRLRVHSAAGRGTRVRLDVALPDPFAHEVVSNRAGRARP